MTTTSRKRPRNLRILGDRSREARLESKYLHLSFLTASFEFVCIVFWIGSVSVFISRKLFPDFGYGKLECVLAIIWPIRYSTVWTETAQNWNKSFTHIEHRTGVVGREGLGSLSLSSLINIYFRLSGFQSSFLLIHFCYRPKTCSHYTKKNNNNNNLYLYSLSLKNKLRQWKY